uniref:Uncharacterized protein n=1 Tax=Picea glauca TaxID=3330 RepID=A0A117NII5_PICGL|nr:hypothetical protein ABT39_MTgene3260 [Picea glauca]QHR89239.1 hypothetical protein Q903MT_gene3259 [Picea sitchensis]
MLEQRVVRRYENRSYSDMCRPPWLYRETSHSFLNWITTNGRSCILRGYVFLPLPLVITL